MAVHQCPRCQLRFSFRTELEFHLREDHDQSDYVVGAREAAERLVAPALVLPDGQVSSPLRTRSERPTLSDTPPEPPRGRSVGGEPLPKVTLMPRRVVVAVIGVVIIGLGLGTLLGS